MQQNRRISNETSVWCTQGRLQRRRVALEINNNNNTNITIVESDEWQSDGFFALRVICAPGVFGEHETRLGSFPGAIRIRKRPG